MYNQSVLATLLFLIVSNPKTYQVVRDLSGLLNKNLPNKIASSSGCPTIVGLLLHAVVFAVLFHFLNKSVAKYLNAGQTGSLSGSIVYSANEELLQDGQQVEKDVSKCYGSTPSAPLPDLEPATESNIGHHP